VMVLMTDSESYEVQSNSAATIGNLALNAKTLDPFMKVWNSPASGIGGYLLRFLNSSDHFVAYIAVWTIAQFLNNDNIAMRTLIHDSTEIVCLIQAIRDRSKPFETVDQSSVDEDSINALVTVAEQVCETLSV